MLFCTKRNCKTSNKRLEAFDAAQQQLEQHVEVEALEDLINEIADYREGAVKARDMLIVKWRSAHPQSDKSDSVSSKGTASIKLPKLDLLKFGGDILKFMPFWQQFLSCVDTQDGMPNVAKFNYLVSLLKGDAKSVVDGLPITEENYEQAKTAIEKRFGRKELIIFSHIQALLNLTVTKDERGHYQLAMFHDKLVANVRVGASLGITSDKFGVILMPIIVSRLTPDILDTGLEIVKGMKVI